MRRTAAWTTAVAGPALVGISLLTAAPAAAQTVDCVVYADRCEVNDQVRDREQETPVDATRVGSDATEVRSTVNARTQPETLPFTGGEVVVLTLIGGAAVVGGAALVVAGRRRAPSAL